MGMSNRTVAALAAPLLLLAVSAARADATIDGAIAARVSKGSKFEVAATVTMANRGVVTLQGTVGGQPFQMQKKFKTKAGKTKSKTIKFVVDPKKLGVQDADDTIVLAGQLAAAEDGQAEPTTGPVVKTLPPPLLIVPGTGNELSPTAYNVFRDVLNSSAGSPWLTKGKRATIKVQNYKSLSIGPIPLSDLGQEIAKAADKMIKKSRFSRCDIVSQSLGGIVVRQAMVPTMLPAKKSAPLSLAGRVRHCYFMGTTHSGTPLAYLAQRAIQAADLLGVDPADLVGGLLGSVDNPSAGDLARILLNKNFLGVVRTFLPTYEFALIPTDGGPIPVGLETLSGGTDVPPLRALNEIAPDEDARYHALHYADVFGATGELRTVEMVDLVAFLAGGGTNLSDVGLLNGPGDGICPVRSTFAEDYGDWSGRLLPVPLGLGVHNKPEDPTFEGFYYYNDPTVLQYLIETSLSPLP